MPALNEEASISAAIDDTLTAFKGLDLKGEVVVINDGSTDSTPGIVKQKMQDSPQLIRMVNHDKPMGVGASFWDGVDAAGGNIICMLPGDNEIEPQEILQYLPLLDGVDMVVPFTFNKEVRTRFRNILSAVYLFIINSTFRTSFNYTNGTIMYRKSLLKELDCRNSSFFFQTDILMRLTKRGYLFAEVPYRLRARVGGKTKAITWRSFCKVANGYFKLIKTIYFKKEDKKGFNVNSATFQRYK